MKKLMQRPNFITFFAINLLFTTTVTWDMIKVFGCSEEFMGKQQSFKIMKAVIIKKYMSRKNG